MFSSRVILHHHGVISHHTVFCVCGLWNSMRGRNLYWFFKALKALVCIHDQKMSSVRLEFWVEGALMLCSYFELKLHNHTNKYIIKWRVCGRGPSVLSLNQMTSYCQLLISFNFKLLVFILLILKFLFLLFLKSVDIVKVSKWKKAKK